MNQQTITINVTDPNLPQLGAAGNWFSDNPILFIALSMALIGGIIATAIYYSHQSKTLEEGHSINATRLRFRFMLPFLILAPLTLLSLSLSPATNSYAAGTPSIDRLDDVTIDIPQGDTTGTATFGLEVSGFTDGFDMLAQLGAAAPAGVAIDIDGVALSDSASTIVHEWRQTAADTSLLTVTATVPSDAPVGADFAIITLNYTVDDFANILSFSTVDASFCANQMSVYGTTSALPNTVTVRDVRNNQTYRVRKLADNRCWMIDNLKLGAGTLTSADSNVSAPFTIGGEVHDITTHANGRCDSTVTKADGAGVLSCDGTTAASSDNLAFSAYTDPSNAAWCANSANWPSGSTLGCGYLYNFYTTTAGTNTVSLSDPTADICPKNWHLPSGNASGEFAVLNGSMHNNVPSPADTGSGTGYFENWQPNAAFSGVFAGQYVVQGGVAQLMEQGVLGFGRLWSKTSNSPRTEMAYTATFATDLINNIGYGYKYSGYAVRCVL